MTDQMQAIRDDITFMKALADEGRNAPLLNGSMLFTAGVVYGGASLVCWVALAMGAPAAYQLVWPAAVILATTIMILLARRLGRKPGRSAAVNRAAKAAWSGVGLAIFAIFAALFVAAWRLHDLNLIYFCPSVILALYGAAWTVSAVMTKIRWMAWAAGGSFVAASALCFFILSPTIYLVFAVSLFLLAALPGFVLMRAEPTDLD
jgi:hypothetical protein